MANLDIMKDGATFDEKYELLRLLGRGGFSEVWLARDNRTQMNVAIKVYAPGTGLDSEGVKMFTQEFSIVTGMNHTNLLRPTYFDSWMNIPYLILPYCSHGSAFKYLTGDRKITEKECWQMLHDVAAGLAYLHAKEPPVVHQDIKPDNILINDEGQYMITDFGISTRVRRTLRATMKGESASAGTRAYMGPERFGRENFPVKANDIWSLGSMMYELMMGDAPFGNDGGLVQKQGAEIPYITGDDYSQELREIIYMCLNKETYKRPTARDIADYADMRIKGFPPEEIIQKQNNSLTNSLGATLGFTKPLAASGGGNVNGDDNESGFDEKDRNKTSFWKNKWLIIIVIALVAIVAAAAYFIIHDDNKINTEEQQKTDTIPTAQRDSTGVVKESVTNDEYDSSVNENKETSEVSDDKINVKHVTRNLTRVSDNPSSKSDEVSHVSNGTLNLGFADYSGGILDNKPNGKGTMRFKRDYRKGDLDAHEGYRLEGKFEKGICQQGILYDSNNEQINKIFSISLQ